MTIVGGGRGWAVVAALVAALATYASAQIPPGDPVGGPEFQVNTTTSGDQSHPSVAVDPGGNFVIVWETYGYEGYGSAIMAQRFDGAGTRLGDEFQVNTGTGDPDEPEIAADRAGNFVVVWSADDGYADGVFGQRLDGAGNFVGQEFQVSTSYFGDQSSPAVAAGPSGNFVVVWETSFDGPGGGIYGRRFDAQGPVGGDFQVSSPTSYAYGIDDPRVSMDALGGFVVVWEDRSYGDGQGAIVGRRFNSDGTPLGGEFVETGQGPQLPDVAGGPSSFVVTWMLPIRETPELLPAEVFFRRFSLLSPTGPVQSAGLGRAPRVARDDAGNFVIVRDSESDTPRSIHGRRYSASGAELGGEFEVTPNDVDYPLAIDMRDSTGDFVVAWSEYIDPAGLEIRARQFTVPSPTPTPTLTPTASPTASPSPSATATRTRTPTASPTVSPTATRTPTQIGAVTPTRTRTPGRTPTPGAPTVEVTAPGNTTASPGQLVEAGRFRVRNTSNAPIFINCTVIDFETPALFLSAIVHGASGQFEGLDKAVPARPSEFCFEPPIRVERGADAEFDLRIGIADRAARLQAPRAVVYASLVGSRQPFWVECLLLLWLVAATAPTKRAAAARVALGLVVLAIAALGGCGDDDDQAAVRGVSTQRLTEIRATGTIGPVTITGLPVTLGTLEVR